MKLVTFLVTILIIITATGCKKEAGNTLSRFWRKRPLVPFIVQRPPSYLPYF